MPSVNPSGLNFCGPSFDWRAFDAYLFDIDGTLLNSRDSVHYQAFLKAVREVCGPQATLHGVTFHGSTDPIILLDAFERGGLARDEAQSALPQAMERICTEVEGNACELRPELCPAVGELLAELTAAGKLLGVATGNLERVGWAKLRAAGIAGHFSFGSFSDLRPSRTEIFRWGASQARSLAADARVCFLGDTPADIAAARACGHPVIAVATGIFSVTELAALGPELCIPACETLCSGAR